MKPLKSRLDRFYDRLSGDSDERVCIGISDVACRALPGNFFKTLVSNTLTSIGDRIASAKTTLPWLLAHAGAPAWCVSLLVPIRESGSMLPQMWIGVWVRRLPVRKWVWVVGSVGQGLCLLGIAAVALTLEGVAAGLAVLLLLAAFAVFRGACSLVHKDVLGKTIPKTRRGRMAGWISGVAGLGALLTGLALSRAGDPGGVAIYVMLLGGAALMWFVAAAVFAAMLEDAGEGADDGNGFAAVGAKLLLLRGDRPFRRFVIARALAMGSGLAAPFYVMLARQDLGAAAGILGMFIIAEGVAGVVSAPIWGRWADRSSRMVFAVASTTAAVLSLAVAAWGWASFSEHSARWFYPLVFLGLGIAHAGVRMGRKTYLVDFAEGNRRTDYVAVSNTAIGMLLLLSGLIGALTSLVSIEATLVLFALGGLAGAVLSLRWKEVSGPEI